MSKYVAHYYRYYSKGAEEFDTAQEAAQYLLNGEYNGLLSWVSITHGKKKIADADNEHEGPYDELYALGAKYE